MRAPRLQLVSRLATAAVAAILVAAAPAVARAQNGGPGDEAPGIQAPSAERLAELRERWDALPEEARARLRAKAKELESLSPEQRQELLKRHRKWKGLPKSEREALRKRQRELRKLDARKRAELRRKQEKLETFTTQFASRLPEGERDAFLALPIAERRERVRAEVQSRRQERFRRMFENLPPDEKERIAGLAHPQREKAIKEAFGKFRRQRDERKIESARRMAETLPEELRDRIRAAVHSGRLQLRELNVDRLRELDPVERERRVRKFLEKVEKRPAKPRPLGGGLNRPGGRERPGGRRGADDGERQ